MKAKAWLMLEVEEVRGSGSSRYQLKITGVRQTRPLDRLTCEVELEVPNEVIFPKAQLLVDHETEIQLSISSREESDVATS